MAVKLNYKGLVFLHTLKEFVEVKHAKLTIINGVLCEAKEVQKARKHANLVLVKSTVTLTDDMDRQTMESKSQISCLV